MKIYLLEQNVAIGWDTYDAVVVIAENEDDARNIHPSPYVTHIKGNKWMGTDRGGTEHEKDNTGEWVPYQKIDKIVVTYIGEADITRKRGVLCASFNAG